MEEKPRPPPYPTERCKECTLMRCLGPNEVCEECRLHMGQTAPIPNYNYDSWYGGHS